MSSEEATIQIFGIWFDPAVNPRPPALEADVVPIEPPCAVYGSEKTLM